jgi:hypothetical protein
VKFLNGLAGLGIKGKEVDCSEWTYLSDIQSCRTICVVAASAMPDFTLNLHFDWFCSFMHAWRGCWRGYPAFHVAAGETSSSSSTTDQPQPLPPHKFSLLGFAGPCCSTSAAQTTSSGVNLSLQSAMVRAYSLISSVVLLDCTLLNQ